MLMSREDREREEHALETAQKALMELQTAFRATRHSTAIEHLGKALAEVRLAKRHLTEHLCGVSR